MIYHRVQDTQDDLSHAAKIGRLDLVLEALADGADMYDYSDALCLAAEAGHLEIVRHLCNESDDVPFARGVALEWAARAGQLAIVRYLLDAGTDIHFRDDAALRGAAQRCHIEVVQYLLDAGANIHVGLDAPLCSAVSKNSLPLVECLVAAAADVNADDGLPLRWAANQGRIEITRCLLAAGASWKDLRPKIGEFSPEIQVALLSSGDVADLSVSDVARQGVCPAGIYVLLERQGQKALSSLLKATRVLEPLTSDARAAMLVEMLAQQQQTELAHVGPG